MPSHRPRIEALLERLADSSMRGSDLDGEIRLDAIGRVRLDAGLRRVFDHALTLLGEFTLTEIRALLAHWVSERHGVAVSEDVLALFERYLALKHAEGQLGDIADPAERLAQLSALRRAHFGADAEALFGSEEAYLAHTLERLALLRDPGLDESARLEALAALEAGRDPGERRAQSLAETPTLLSEHESQLQALQADATQRFAERSALWGEAAAERLAALDAAEAEWARRLDDYRSERARLMADPTLDETTRRQALEAMLASRFSEAERRRVVALSGLPGSG
ncbi:lipase secretion chaperone [Pseudomarimonas salicorniae]|uniref:Lipase chaperone n=1 Tax=Pseudomarimonas salicorniae TaxID=2933270 RepID=A0ABT0GI44_9GAMM|nr:lipase secretion chaperone [Lysobacter sp. CAU 1642]MCK7594219.1 hypothetical protein [Lysobacter sp. CAU 1642]